MVALDGKVVVITGAGSGIGRATAVAFAERGARVHGADVREDRVVALDRELAGRGLAFTPHVVDVADAAAVQRLARAVHDADGRVDVLHNNAGLVVGGQVQHLSLDDWRLAVDVNLMGVVHGVHAFVPRMILQGGGGHVVNTASVAGLLGFPVMGPYAATKFAVVGLSESLDAELAAHDIRVTALCPGMVRTNVLDAGHLTLPGDGVELLRTLFRHLALSPEELATEVVSIVRRRQGGIRTVGLGTRQMWLARRGSVAAYQGLMRQLSRRVLGRGAGR